VHLWYKSRIKKTAVLDVDSFGSHLLESGMLICTGMLLSELIYPMRILIKLDKNAFIYDNATKEAISMYCLYWAITAIILLIILFVTHVLYYLFSDKKSIFIDAVTGNHGLVILYIGILVAITLVTKSVMPDIFDQYIPYPAVPGYM